METLKQIPSGFFDAIARIAPGALGLVAFLCLGGLTWEHIVTQVFGTTVAKSPLTTFSLFTLFSYISGQLIAPFAKLFQRMGEKVKIKDVKKAPNGAYDYLRLKHPEQGAQCAKIRAEFTMHNGFGVVFLTSSIAYFYLQSIDWIFMLLVFFFCSSTVRGRTVRDTFNETVEKYSRVTNFQVKRKES